ncbi:MAG TPA: FecR family protein, partial [Reyranella sp.]
ATLVVGSDIFIGDTVNTGPQGQVQILFADETKLVVGPHSSLKIEDYLIRNDGSAGKLAVDMLGGSFRFATGDAAKNRYLINTPTGTIGVRGTHFDVFVDTDGVTRILHYEGIVRFCTLDNKCEELSDLCTLGQLSSDAVILGDTRKIKGAARNEVKSEFIYSDNQAPLLRQFWFAHSFECTHNVPQGEDLKGPTPNHPDAPPPPPPSKPGRVPGRGP